MSKRTTATCYCGAVQLEIVGLSSAVTCPKADQGLICSSASPRRRLRQYSCLSLQRLPTRDRHNVRLQRLCLPLTSSTERAGSLINFQLTVETPHLRHVRGEDNLSAYATAKTINTGNTMTSSFCKTCGALMYRRSSGFPGLSFCRIGTVDDIELHDEILKPMAEQFTVSRVKWLEPVEGVRQTEGMSTE
nr:hypothetical protein B0A51_10562 [Rachicladosporium sp. CCFEE 5018]